MQGKTLGATLKITLDLSKLLEEGKLTPEEVERLKVLAARIPAHLPSIFWSGSALLRSAPALSRWCRRP